MPAITSLFPTLLEPILKEAIMMEIPQSNMDFKDICKTQASKKNKETDATYADLAGLTLAAGETDAVVYQDPIEGFKTEYTHKRYLGGVQFSDSLFDDDLYGVVTRYGQALTRSYFDTVNRVAFDKLLNGFAAFLLADGQAFFSNSHPLKNSASLGDNLVGATALNETSLQDAINLAEMTLSDSALFVPVHPETVIVHTSQQFTIAKLLNSAQAAFTADNDVNAFKMKRLKYIATPYLAASPNFWFLRAAQHWFKFFLRKDLTLETQREFQTKAIQNTAETRFSAGVSDWRGYIGANPA